MKTQKSSTNQKKMEPYNWISKREYTKIKLQDLFKYDSAIQSFKSRFTIYYAFEDEEFSNKLYTNDISMEDMVCNERYVFVLLQYKKNEYTLFVIDTTLPIDDYKVYDFDAIATGEQECEVYCRKRYGCKQCTENPTCENYKSLESQLKDMKMGFMTHYHPKTVHYTTSDLVAMLNAVNKPNTMSTVRIRDETTLKLYTLQDSNEEECVIISDNFIYLYKNGQVYEHEYMFTIRYIELKPDVLYLSDEFDMVYSYTYSNDEPIKQSRPGYIRERYNFACYDKTRIDTKGNRYRLTWMDTYPMYTLIENAHPPSLYPRPHVCISKTLCAFEWGNIGLTSLIRGLPPPYAPDATLVPRAPRVE